MENPSANKIKLAHALCSYFNEKKQSYIDWEEEVQFGADYIINISKDGTEEAKQYIEWLSMETVLSLLQSGQGFIFGHYTDGCAIGCDKYIVTSDVLEIEGFYENITVPISELITKFEKS